jgi:diguanylate cyclase (GGDEF)-like protein/PAS domain S-box-containing protein
MTSHRCFAPFHAALAPQPAQTCAWSLARPGPDNLMAVSFACALLDAVPQQIAVLDADGAVVAVNAAWRKHSGTCPGPLAPPIGARFGGENQGGPPAGDVARVKAGIEAVLAGAAPLFTMEFFVEDDCGAGYSLQAMPFCEGWPGAVVSIADITEHKQQLERQRIAAIAFESPQGMLITDVQGRILQVNAAFTEITGYTQAEVLHKSPSILSSGRHGPDFYRVMWQEIARKGSWEGEIWNRRKNGEVYPERLHIAAVLDEHGGASHYVASLSDITLSKAANDEIKSLAFYDPLTRLPNRRLLMDRLGQAITGMARQGRPAALMFLDLDNFKTLNDTLGHSVGDQLLYQVAQRLTACVREGDTVARLGGDEFVVILEQIGDDSLEAAEHARAIASGIVAMFALPFELGPHVCRSTSSIGITLFDHVEQTPDQVLMQGDIAMYGAKQAGRNGICFYDREMQDKIAAQAQMDSDLGVALELGQFEAFYQPQVDIDGRVCGAEALIRWHKPDGSWVSPAQFIPRCEETGLIVEIGDWMLEQACAQLQLWALGAETAPLTLAVNVSALQFRHPDFAAKLRALLDRHAFDRALFKIELTEGVLLETPTAMIDCMNTLRSLGIRFSLDDFGTGYSSLQYLKRLPLDQLKIDQSFVRELVTSTSDRVIVKTIIAMAHSLNLDVIAEGVETMAQRDILCELGCLQFQGYLFGRPMPADLLAAHLAAAVEAA